MKDRAERMDPRSTVRPHRSEEAQAHAELIEDLTPAACEVRTDRGEFTPSDFSAWHRTYAPIGCQTVLDSMNAVIS